MNDSGQGLVEYALILAMIALALVAVLTLFGVNFFEVGFSQVVQSFVDATTP
jgi:Flp pilus assembly pilin Flp